jgi:hypothetical protein
MSRVVILMIEILQSRFKFFNDQRSSERFVEKKKEFVKNFEKSRNRCLSNATAQTKSFIAAMINIILN